MTLEQRKAALKKLGNYIQFPDEEFSRLINNAQHTNAWFTPQETSKAIAGIAKMLSHNDIDTWLNEESNGQGISASPKIVGLVLAGNIPLVGFHDIISVLMSGNIALIKVSSQDQHLIPYLLNKLIAIEPEFKNQIRFTERLEGFDAVIATGSNNSSRYFEYYFGKVPHIIRKNRNSIAVLTGNESTEELHRLGSDIFDFFGLGCRNVSKIYVPEGYEFSRFFESIESYKAIGNHNKYANNYDYNKSIYLINREKHFDNGFLLVKQDERLSSPLAVLFYEEYNDLSALNERISSLSGQIQCIVSNEKLDTINQQVGFGESQHPRLWDYADGLNTIEFLRSL